MLLAQVRDRMTAVQPESQSVRISKFFFKQ